MNESSLGLFFSSNYNSILHLENLEKLVGHSSAFPAELGRL